MTYTCALLAIPSAAFAEITARIERVNQTGDYNHMFHHSATEGDWIDMTHIGIVADKQPTPTLDMVEVVLDALNNLPDGGPNSGFCLTDESRIELPDAKRFVEALIARGYTVQRVAAS